LEVDDQDKKAIGILRAVYRGLGDEAAAERLREMRVFRRRVMGFRSRPLGDGEGVKVEGMLKHEKSRDHAWEVGQLNLILGNHHLNETCTQASVADAEKYFRSAMDSLGEYPREIARSGVHALLARALIKQEKTAEALHAADQAVGLNPMSSAAHATRGYVLDALGDLEAARDAWSDALLWDPTDVTLYWNVGYCYWKLGQEATGGDERRRALHLAATYLEQASILFPDERRDDRLRIQYWLARVCEEIGEVDRVIASLRIVQTSREDVSVIADLLVGRAYRQGGNYNAAEALLEKVNERVTSVITRDGSAPVLGEAKLGDAWPLRIIQGEANCALALSRVERGGDSKDARNALDQVRRLLEDREMVGVLAAEHPRRLAELRGHYHHALGSVHRSEGDVDATIKALTRSIGYKQSPEVYFDLAEVYLTKAAESDATERERNVLVYRAHCYRELVGATDLRGAYARRLEELVELANSGNVDGHRVAARGSAGGS
jgi:tetratricopeptide (TPR) repeat protein